jgi:hypothetical protein
MVRNERTYYTYTFEQKDRQALKEWLKANNIKVINLHKELGICYRHMFRIIYGERPASSSLVNKLKKMGFKFPKS